jgi:hypothetical protein
MNNVHKIPRGASAGVAFLGIELLDTLPLIFSIFISLILASNAKLWEPLTVVFGGYFLTKTYVDIKKQHLNGYFQTLMYLYGIDGYSKAFKKSNTVFLGSSLVLNPGILLQISEK